jgi:hypothetical protein
MHHHSAIKAMRPINRQANTQLKGRPLPGVQDNSKGPARRKLTSDGTHPLFQDTVRDPSRIIHGDRVGYHLLHIRLSKIVEAEIGARDAADVRIPKTARRDRNHEERIAGGHASNNAGQLYPGYNRRVFDIGRQPANRIRGAGIGDGLPKQFFGVPFIQIVQILPGRYSHIVLGFDQEPNLGKARSPVADKGAASGVGHDLSLRQGKIVTQHLAPDP